jgi:hypothetical protein
MIERKKKAGGGETDYLLFLTITFLIFKKTFNLFSMFNNQT